MALTSLVNLEERLGITGTNPAETTDDYLNNLISRAGQVVESVIGRTVEKTQFTEYHSGNGTRWMHLRQGPVVAASTAVAVSSVVYDSAGAETLTSINAGDFRVWGAENEVDWKLPGTLEQVSYWVSGHKNYKVVYYGGWATVPSDIEEACLHACVWMKNKRRDTATSDRSVGESAMGGFSSLNDLIAELRQMLAPYIPVHF